MKSRCGYVVAEERPRPTGRLTISPSGLLKIAERGYELDDAQAVFDRDPVWIWQDARERRDEAGRWDVRPARWRMVGRGPGGQVLAVVIDLPGQDGKSEVVSIYEASGRDQSRYAERARRRR